MATEPVTFRPHVVERFQERVAPGLDFRDAKHRLKSLVRQATTTIDRTPPSWLNDPPPWAQREMAKRKHSWYIHVSEDVVLPAVRLHEEGLVAVTCITRGSISKQARRNRNERKQGRRRHIRRVRGKE